jgi:hypothetical protein
MGTHLNSKLEEFAVRPDASYPTISQVWRRNREHVSVARGMVIFPS